MTTITNIQRWLANRFHEDTRDAGMSTAEYAIGTVAAAAFAAVLYTVVTGHSVLDGLTALVQHALTVSL